MERETSTRAADLLVGEDTATDGTVSVVDSSVTNRDIEMDAVVRQHSTRRWWNWYFMISTPLIAVLIMVSGSAVLPYRVAAACLIVIPSVVFLCVVEPHTAEWLDERRMSSKSGARGWFFVALVVVCQLSAYACDPQAMFAQVFMVPELFIAFTYRSGLWIVASVSVAMGVISVAQIWIPTVYEVVNIVVDCGGSVVFSAVMGGAIDQIVRMNNHNQRLVTRLLEQQQQIRRLSHDEGMMAERQRVAGEVHDTLAQSLASMLALGRTSREESRSCDRDDRERLDAHLAMITTMAQEGLNDARRLVAGGMPSTLQDRGLRDAIQRTVQRFSQETGIGTTLDCGEDEIFALDSQQLQVVILRIVQESLANIRSHACAHGVEVNAIRMHDEPRAEKIVVTITDDGVGFDVDAQEREHLAGYQDHGRGSGLGYGYGLTDMRRRVGQLGGTLRIDSAPGLGTTVQATLPVLRASAGTDAKAVGADRRDDRYVGVGVVAGADVTGGLSNAGPR